MTIRHASRRRSSITLVSFGLIALSVISMTAVAVMRIASIGRDERSGTLTLTLIGVLGVFVLVAALFWFFRLGALHRVDALDKQYPDALIASASVTQDFGYFARSDDSPATMRGLPLGNAYVAIVVDKDSVRIFRGGRRPRLKVTIPAAAVQRFEAGSWMAGPVRTVPAVIIDVTSKSGSTLRLPIQLLPWNQTFFPRFGKPPQVSRFCDSASTVLGLPA